MKAEKGDHVKAKDTTRERVAEAVNTSIQRYTQRGLQVDDISDGKKTIGQYKAEIKKLKTELTEKSTDL